MSQETSHSNNDIDHASVADHTNEAEVIHAEDIIHEDAHADEHAGESHGEHHEHEHTLYAETVFNIGDFNVTNSLLTSWVAVFLIIVLSLVIRAKNSRIPAVFQSFLEVVIDGALDMMDLVTNDREKSRKVFPIVFAIFLFVLINNWLGLVPGLGSITYDGTALFRGATADLNTTLALGLFSIISANIFGIMVVGGWNYFNKFINVKALIEIPGKIKNDPTIVLVNPITFFVGLIEIVSEIAKVASLSFRLFGNIFAGEVLIASISAMVAFGVPLPFMFLEVIVGIIQALIFSILTLVYYTIASTEHAH
ncbi:MAG: F0F1 ATP synthase subunit A [Candidatus Komeilibacteria bacterium]|jgi:F-type H+-transporting ATPase subunit a|nr:F0F1 ATP synthase subunit A [Candidatus Komeilibacteria bacterium]MBT4447272.1 F0F1 ATP synthase subunit A [Candidatus Komeilibacteria bacterium]